MLTALLAPVDKVALMTTASTLLGLCLTGAVAARPGRTACARRDPGDVLGRVGDGCGGRRRSPVRCPGVMTGMLPPATAVLAEMASLAGCGRAEGYACITARRESMAPVR